MRREEVERERDELLRRLKVLGGPPSVEEATAGEAGREVLGQADAGAPTDVERRSWWRSVFATNRAYLSLHHYHWCLAITGVFGSMYRSPLY